MSTFLGVGLGPIQTGIFIAGASRAGFDKIVIAEVDDSLKNAINDNGGKITINIAADDSIYADTYSNIEVYNPNIPEEREKLCAAAAEATELATALPSVKFFSATAEWLRAGFEKNPDLGRFIYTAENNNHAAEELEIALGKKFENTFCLNTVIGKMSGVRVGKDIEDKQLFPLAPNAGRAHLVEEFDKILISSCPEINERKVMGLHAVNDLLPFEEAKLYGHNAVHFLLGALGKHHGFRVMSELRNETSLMDIARKAFIEESGKSLIKKYSHLKEELFTKDGFTEYAEDLLVRMTNPYLFDEIERIVRDLPRKLSWEDRVIGTMRLALSQDVTPETFAMGAKLASEELPGATLREKFAAIWPEPWSAEHDEVLALISNTI